MRKESDFLGEVELPADQLSGIHTYRARVNFQLSGRTINARLIHAFGMVKQACAICNNELGYWKNEKIADAVIQASSEMSSGLLDSQVDVDALQGGAGTSTNMSVNEVLANRALQILGKSPGEYGVVSPVDDVNRHQSTNDTFPTALKLAAIQMIKELEQAVLELQESFQDKEKEFAHVVKIGRTQLQDAVLTTLGREMSAYAEALSRDRWRIFKCIERLRVINLGGTAIGSGLGAPRKYIFKVCEKLRELSSIPFARADNLNDVTQNQDVFVEVSGLLKALAVTLHKSANDLRLMASGPTGGIGEIDLPARQAGSSLMPGKVNPVIPEAIIQSAMVVQGNDQIISTAVAAGNLELNAFMPLIADRFLDSISILTRACVIYRSHCITGMKANENRCRQLVNNSMAMATALVVELGYDRVNELIESARIAKTSIRQQVLNEGLITETVLDRLLSAESVCKLGS
jgi:aspartate ammonia-lyase